MLFRSTDTDRALDGYVNSKGLVYLPFDRLSRYGKTRRRKMIKDWIAHGRPQKLTEAEYNAPWRVFDGVTTGRRTYRDYRNLSRPGKSYRRNMIRDWWISGEPLEQWVESETGLAGTTERNEAEEKEEGGEDEDEDEEERISEEE